MIRRRALLGLSLILAVPATAQVRPVPVGGDARIQQIIYAPNQVFEIGVTPGYAVTIHLAPDEIIGTVVLGNSAAWQVVASHAGDSLFVKASQAGDTTNMTITTNVRSYAFTLVSGEASGQPNPYTVTFQYPRPASIQAASSRTVGLYKLAGARSLWPSRISDDGQHVFIEWPENVDLPAIYAIDGQGREALTNGMMRDGRMVIDGLAPRLIFRIDRNMASATRVLAQTPKP